MGAWGRAEGVQAMRYLVYLNIAYKRGIRDPEGEAIQREIFERRGVSAEVRAGKCLIVAVEAATPEEAGERALKLAWDLRLGNPNVHVVEVVKVEHA